MENILKYSSSETTELFENKLLAGMLLGWSAIISLWIVQDDGHYAKINHFSQKNRHVWTQTSPALINFHQNFVIKRIIYWTDFTANHNYVHILLLFFPEQGRQIDKRWIQRRFKVWSVDCWSSIYTKSK